MTLAANVGHGKLALASDGSFTYQPDSGYIGPDAFEYVVTLADQTSAAVKVTIDVSRVDQPSASPGDAFAIGSIARGGPNSSEVTFGSLGPLSFSFEWLIPSLAIAGPGLLLILVLIGAQLLAGAAWLPLVRRDVGDFGMASRRLGRPNGRR